MTQANSVLSPLLPPGVLRQGDSAQWPLSMEPRHQRVRESLKSRLSLCTVSSSSRLALGRGWSTMGVVVCRALPSECHSGPQARRLASSPRESKAETAQTKGQMKANGEFSDFSLSPSSSQAQGAQVLGRRGCKSSSGARLSADSYLSFLVSWHPQTLSSSPHHLPPRVLQKNVNQ